MPPEHRADLVAGACVERGEGLPTSLRKQQEPAPAVGFGTSFLDQALLLETAQNSAQVASIQSQLLTEFARHSLFPVGNLVEDAYPGQGERTLQIPVPQYADLPSPEPVEAPYISYASIEIVV